MEGGRRRPTAEELISKLKDDGDFDNLRLMIIRKIKENEELRSNIVTEVKQSAIFNQEGSENLGPKQLSDAVYQELGKKIMGQISDELWKVIRTNENVKTDIRGTAESVYNRILNPNMKKEDHHASPSKENSVNGKEKSVSPLKASTVQTDTCDESELGEPPGFVQSDQVTAKDHKVESEERDEGQNPHVPTEEVSRGPPNPVDDDDDNDMPPPGFGTSCLGNGASVMSLGSAYGGGAGFTTSDNGGIAMPPRLATKGRDGSGGGVSTTPHFGTGSRGGAVIDVVPPGFSVSGGGGGADDEDDDPDVPPGFG